MKSVKGEVLSTAPISISKAAKVLSKFITVDTGASQAVCAYLRRASASFNELNQLHKELKSHRKQKISNSENAPKDGESTRSFISNQGDGEESGRKKNEKKKEKKKNKKGGFDDIVKSEGETVEDKVRVPFEASGLLGVETEKKKQEKKRGEVRSLEEAKSKVKIEEDGNAGNEYDDRNKHKKNKVKTGGKIGYLEEDNSKIKIEDWRVMGMDNETKKHKKMRDVGDVKENGGGNLIEKGEKKKKKKKRKSEEIEGSELNSGEFRSKKKKKRKSEGEN